MINREDMLELTRRMTPSRTSFTRVAGGYMEPDGEIDESFNVNFLNLSAAEKEKNLAIAKAVPFAATNVNLRSYAFGDGAEQRKMRQLLYGMRECGLKNDALLYTFYQVFTNDLALWVPGTVAGSRMRFWSFTTAMMCR